MSTASATVRSLGLFPSSAVTQVPVSLRRKTPNLKALPPEMLPNRAGNSSSFLNSSQ